MNSTRSSVIFRASD